MFAAPVHTLRVENVVGVPSHSLTGRAGQGVPGPPHQDTITFTAPDRSAASLCTSALTDEGQSGYGELWVGRNEMCSQVGEHAQDPAQPASPADHAGVRNDGH